MLRCDPAEKRCGGLGCRLFCTCKLWCASLPFRGRWRIRGIILKNEENFIRRLKKLRAAEALLVPHTHISCQMHTTLRPFFVVSFFAKPRMALSLFLFFISHVKCYWRPHVTVSSESPLSCPPLHATAVACALALSVVVCLVCSSFMSLAFWWFLPSRVPFPAQRRGSVLSRLFTGSPCFAFFAPALSTSIDLEVDPTARTPSLNRHSVT